MADKAAARDRYVPLTSGRPTRQNGKPVIVGSLLAVITLAVFWPVTGFDFTNYDDPIYVADNSLVQQGLTWRGFEWAFGGRVLEWHPLTWLSHMLDCQLFGLRPGWHHLTNLLFHTTNTLLLFLVLMQVTGALWRGAIVAALFGLHPLHVESVAWVAERKDLLSTLFFLLTLWAYVHYAGFRASQSSRRTLRATWYGLALLLFIFALMSKPMVVTLPFVLLLLDYWPLQRLRFSTINSQPSNFFRLVWEKLPFFLLSAAASMVALGVEHDQRNFGGVVQHLLSSRALNALTSYFEYLRKTAWPSDLAVFYPYPKNWPTETVMVAALLLIGVSLLVIRWRHRPYLAVGWFWFLGTLLPVIGLVQVGIHAMADRYSYIPSIGLFMVVAFGVDEVTKRLPYQKTALTILAILTLIGCVAVTRSQILHWRDSETLFRHAIKVTGGNSVAYNNLGTALQGQGKLAQAVVCFTEASRLNPEDSDAHNNIGVLLTDLARYEEALAHLTTALRLNPRIAVTHYNLGNLMVRLDQRTNAIHHYRQALELAPNDSAVNNNLAALLVAERDFVSAEKFFRAAIRCDPANAEAYSNLGGMLTDLGKPDEAVPLLRQALHLKPDDANAHYNLGAAYAGLKKISEARAEYETTLRLNPRHDQAHFKLGNLFFEGRQAGPAASHYRAALAANPNHAEAHYQLATILVVRQEVAEAITHYRAALRGQPDWLEALNNLAWLLATHPDARYRNGKEAVELATLAVTLTSAKDPDALDTLAAAYAEAGKFSEAVVEIKKALTLMSAPGLEKRAAELKARLSLYESSTPFREPSL